MNGKGPPAIFDFPTCSHVPNHQARQRVYPAWALHRRRARRCANARARRTQVDWGARRGPRSGLGREMPVNRRRPISGPPEAMAHHNWADTSAPVGHAFPGARLSSPIDQVRSLASDGPSRPCPTPCVFGVLVIAFSCWRFVLPHITCFGHHGRARFLPSTVARRGVGQ